MTSGLEVYEGNRKIHSDTWKGEQNIMEKDKEEGVGMENVGQDDAQKFESFRARSARKQRRDRNRREQGRKKIALLGAAALVLLLLVLVIAFMYKRYAPSKKVMPLTQYFEELKDGEILLFNHDTQLEEKGLLDGEHIYLPYDVVVSCINKRFYFDNTENILSYTTATEVIRTEVGSSFYYMNKSKTDEGYAIVKA